MIPDVDFENNLVMWTLIVGFFSPIILALINRTAWTSARKAAVTFGWSVAVGAGIAYFADMFNGRDVVTAILLVLVVSITVYKGLWKPTGIAPAIEARTSPDGETE